MSTSEHQMFKFPLKPEFPTTTAVLIKMHVHRDNRECSLKLTIHRCQAFKVLHLDKIKQKQLFIFSPEALTKGNRALQNHFLSNVAPNTSYLTNPSLFEVQTRKNEGAFLGLARHMTAIWGNCVFWLKRVVYDRWQGRKSRAAGSSTDMQIAFSWLLYSLRYLSSGLQHACLFTARKQLINSTKGRRKERCFCWFHSLPWKLKLEVVSEGQEISIQVHCVWPHQSRHRGETQTPQNLHPLLRLIWDKIEFQFEWQVVNILMIIVS